MINKEIINRKILIAIIFLVILAVRDSFEEFGIVGNPLLRVNPCEDDKISLSFEPGLPPEEENQYYVYIDEVFPSHSRVNLKFDSEAVVTLQNPSVARISSNLGFFQVKFFRHGNNLSFKVKGLVNGTVPYLTSVDINNVERCKNHTTGYLDELIMGYRDTASIDLSVPDESCGRRKVQHTELITNGHLTKPGDWPWHVAIYRLESSEIRYICGGTLVSKTSVLTAAHCVTIRGVPVSPEILSVVLGKYNLIGGDVAAQEREIHRIIVHEDFIYRQLHNDIAMLKLKSEALFSDYIQPACLWSSDVVKKLPKGNIFGTVVGWGFDHTDRLSSQLRQASMPKVSDAACIKTQPVFFGTLLNGKKFCAGLLNGTSACNGDSGGGFHVYIADSTANTNTGAWYIRGIVSLSMARRDVALCDPTHYVIFTDVAKYKDWVKNNSV